MRFYAGLDVGGTSGRVRFLDENGSEIGDFLGQGCAFNTEGVEAGKRKYTALMQAALEQYGLKAPDCLGICVAASGIDSLFLEASCRQIFADMGFVRERILIVNDCELLLYQSEGSALVVVAGTGSICFGRDGEGRIFRTGGWNHVLSDEGSSYDIGLETIKAAADCMDGRIPDTSLAGLLKETAGIGSLEEADRYINTHLMDKSAIGGLAGVCAGAAEAGDETAVGILRRCADKVFRLVADTAAKMGLLQTMAEPALGGTSGILLWLWGSVAVRNDIFRERLVNRIKEELPFLTVDIPHKTALQIAAETAFRYAGKEKREEGQG